MYLLSKRAISAFNAASLRLRLNFGDLRLPVDVRRLALLDVLGPYGSVEIILAAKTRNWSLLDRLRTETPCHVDAPLRLKVFQLGRDPDLLTIRECTGADLKVPTA